MWNSRKAAGDFGLSPGTWYIYGYCNKYEGDYRGSAVFPSYTQLFDVIVTGEDIHNGKPEPDVYLRASELLGIEPEECLVLRIFRQESWQD